MSRCSYGGSTYGPGESFPAIDGCNTCSCGADAQVATRVGAAKRCTITREKINSQQIMSEIKRAEDGAVSAFDGIAGVVLDFGLNSTLGALTIEEALNYRAVREAIRFPAFIHVTSNLKEHEAYALLTVGIQAVVLTASETEETTQTEIKALREVLEKVHQEDKDKDKDKDSPSVPPQARK